MAQVSNKSHNHLQNVQLRDGMVAGLRKILPNDMLGIRRFYSRLSPETIYFRYLSYRPAFSPAEEKHCSTIEPGMRMAIVGEIDL
ncbi:MAG: hypothetical protein N2D54_06495, partial [Chloroflexota bacterium]